MDANLAAAIMLASGEACIDIAKATTDLIARINGDKSNQALEKYDNIIFRVGLAATSSTCLQSLPDEQCIEALAHVIRNMDKYRPPATKSSILNRCAGPLIILPQKMINNPFINRMR